VLRIVAQVRVTEVFTAAALLTVVGTALLVNAVGLSMALGAFLAGVLLADSEFRHELEADIEPFKGLLLGLFFIAVGMSANLGLLTSDGLAVAGLTLGFLAVKLTRHSADSALRLGFSMAAGGEFAFVLFGLASRQGIVGTALADTLVLAVTLSMVLGPLLLALYEAVGKRWLPRGAARPFDAIEDTEPRVIIAGFGRFGQIVGRVLRARCVPFTALDASQTHIDFVRRFGNQVYYGDASRLDLLRAAGAERARVLVLAIDDVEASVRAAALVRAQFPALKVYARARSRQHAFQLMEAGVHWVIRETYVSSLEMAGVVLEALGETPAGAREVQRAPGDATYPTSLRCYAGEMLDSARDIHDYWFGPTPLTPAALGERMRFWFGGDDAPDLQRARDEEVAARFGGLIERALTGELDSWAGGPRRLLALILLLDQFPRNAWRGTARAFAGDERALACARGGMQTGADAVLLPVERMFFYMPLQHAESAEVQDESVAAYRRLVLESPGAIRGVLEGTLKYAEMHRDIVARFGRFPHRNAVLGRTSTAEEEAYLAGGAERFGQ
jgi:uncharacterized protein (DUF924 family)/voltage-gated potassium channel Kch